MLQRDYYLKNLGIVQYVPQEFCLPPQAAVASGTLEPRVPESKVLESGMPVGNTPASTNSSALEAIKSASLQSQPSAQPAAPPTNQPIAPEKPEVQAQTSATEEPVRFAICHWLVGETLVFSGLDYGQNPPQDQHQLLANILKSIGRLASPLSEPEVVQWPLVATAPGGESQARAMFTSLLQGRVEQSGCRLVLVMGSRASQFLLPVKSQSDDATPVASIALSDHCQLLVTPGLDDMLTDPQHKRATWELLRPLATQ